MDTDRPVKPLKDGRHQAVAPCRSLLAVLGELTPIDNDFPDIDDPPPEPVEF